MEPVLLRADAVIADRTALNDAAAVGVQPGRLEIEHHIPLIRRLFELRVCQVLALRQFADGGELRGEREILPGIQKQLRQLRLGIADNFGAVLAHAGQLALRLFEITFDAAEQAVVLCLRRRDQSVGLCAGISQQPIRLCPRSVERLTGFRVSFAPGVLQNALGVILADP